MRITEALKREVEPLKGRLPEEQVLRLMSLGITTAEELRDQLAFGNALLLYNFLDSPGAPAAPILRAPRVAPSAWGRSSGMAPYRMFSSIHDGGAPALLRRARGVMLAEAQRNRRALPPSPIRSHAEDRPGGGVDLTAQMPEVRNQGGRATSVAFAVSALREGLGGLMGEACAPLSSQFIYWKCKELDSKPKEEGTDLGIGMAVLHEIGAPPATLWRYSPAPDPTGNEGQGPPPRESVLTAKAKSFRIGRYVRLRSRDVRALRATLEGGNLVVLAVHTFAAWDYPSTALSGDISLPLPGDNADGAHAVLLVGFEDNAALPGGGAFAFHNSWGRSWGEKNRYGAGRGTLPYAYVALYATEAYTVEH